MQRPTYISWGFFQSQQYCYSRLRRARLQARRIDAAGAVIPCYRFRMWKPYADNVHRDLGKSWLCRLPCFAVKSPHVELAFNSRLMLSTLCDLLGSSRIAMSHLRHLFWSAWVQTRRLLRHNVAPRTIGVLLRYTIVAPDAVMPILGI